MILPQSSRSVIPTEARADKSRHDHHLHCRMLCANQVQLLGEDTDFPKPEFCARFQGWTRSDHS